MARGGCIQAALSPSLSPSLGSDELDELGEVDEPLSLCDAGAAASAEADAPAYKHVAEADVADAADAAATSLRLLACWSSARSRRCCLSLNSQTSM